MEPTQSAIQIPGINAESRAPDQRQRNHPYRERITPEQAAENRKRRREHQLRIRNSNQGEQTGMPEHRRTSQRLRRTNVQVEERNETTGTFTDLHEYVPTHSIYEHGSSSNSRQPRNVMTTPNNVHNVMRPLRVYGCARFAHQPQYVDCFKLSEVEDCSHCKAKLFQYEKSTMCCNNKTLKLEKIVAPFEMLYLFSDQTPLGRHFRNNIRAYNHVFSFTSMGVHVDETVRTQAQGIYTFRAQGAIYHKIGNLLPDGNERPRYLQLYFFDTDHEIQNRINENTGLQSGLLENITTILNLYNPFVNNFRHMAQRADLQNCKLQILELPPNRRQYDLPSASEVAAVIVGGEEAGIVGKRDIVVQAVGGELIKVFDTAGYYDPLQYPLLLPYGTYGWTPNCSTTDGRKITCCDFYSYMMQIRPNDMSILLRGGRLLQQYIVDMYVKIESNILRWVRNNQKKIRQDSYKGLLDAIHAGEHHAGRIGKITILPSSIVGSPRDMYQRYQDAMTLVQKYGKPDLFITMTCNPSWSEIKDELLPGQVPNDRPDLLARVFRCKFEELKDDINKKHVLGKVKAYVYVIEFQKRGLPHAHILLIMDDADKLRTPDDYDCVVRAEIPDKNQEPELHQIVVKHMLHGPCGDYNKTSPCMKEGKCKKRFPKQFSEETKVGVDSYPVYRRREGEHVVLRGNMEVSIDNSWVVPYNPWLLLKYNCHINVEICSSIESVKYLYKYVYKGPDRVSLQLRQSPDYDEVKQYVDGRWISAQEACWRIFQIPMSRINPCVERLPIHLENQQLIRFNADQTIDETIANDLNSRTMLTEFFKLNVEDPAANQYLYREIPTYYRWCENEKKWIRRRSAQRVVGRIYTVSPSEGERFYLRILLNHITAITSFAHLLIVDGQQCSSYKHAAEQYGLLQHDDSIRQCLLEAASFQMPATLRHLFASILVNCQPTDTMSLWNEIYPFLCQDYAAAHGINDNRVLNNVLKDLNTILERQGKSVEKYNIPQLTMVSNDTPAEKLIQEERSIIVSIEDLSSVHKMNNDQKVAFDKIMEAVQGNKNAMFFIDGPGGTGKTYLYRALLATVRNAGDIALATASSGIAATLLPGGRTAHSRFKIPLNLHPTSTCNIEKQGNIVPLLRAAKVIIWDEAPMTNRYAFEALSRTLIDILGVDMPFGGKIMVFGGDFRQVLPVVQKGTRAQTIAASIVKSPLWEYVTVLHLKQNMRSINDHEFAEFLLRVGNGSEPTTDDDMIQLPNSIAISWEGPQSLDTLINNIYPDLEHHINNASYMLGRGLITPLNDDVNKINDKVISRFIGQEKTYHSFDSVDNDTYNTYQQEFLNSISPAGMPPHILRLKVGAPIMLLRNMDPAIGLCNGTRLICRSLNRNFIDAEILDGPHHGTRTFIHRIPIKPPDTVQLPFVMIRVQFPVKLSFALTINKAQGQTIPHVGIYLPDPVFSHGQLYVALSRGVSRQTTKVLVAKKSNRRNIEVHTRNVVYHEILMREEH